MKNEQKFADRASLLVTELKDKHNVFLHKGIGILTPERAETSCSTFVHHHLTQTFENYPHKYMRAGQLHDEILEGGFDKPLTKVTDLYPGVIAAIKYDNKRDGMSGHCFIVAEAPVFEAEGFKYNEYRILVIDSCRTSHNVYDTRWNIVEKKGDGGIGRGMMKLLSDKKTGEIVGYAWSVSIASELMYNGDGQNMAFAGIPSAWKVRDKQHG